MMTALAILVAALAGAAWRRWFGSARPDWMKPIDAWWRDYFGIVRPDKGAPYRAAQIFVGCVGLFLLCWAAGDPWWRAAIETAAAMVVVTVSAHTRDPFIAVAEWLVARGLPTTENLPHPYKTWLNGPAPISEAMQGALLWGLAAWL